MSLPTSFRKQRRTSRLAWGIGVAVLIGVVIFMTISNSGSSSLSVWRASEKPQQDTGRRYFEETGFEISGKFLEYFTTHGDLGVFGYPVSAEYNQQGVLVQYFQKARMEWHVVGPDANRVTLGKLGEELGFQSEGLDEPVKSTRRRFYFPETQHTVAYFFLKYFNSHGGVDVFGPPITEMYIEDEKIVQYFQRLKLEWDPGLMRVTTGNLGDLYVKTYRDSFAANVLTPPDLQFGANTHEELAAMVGVSHATLGSNHVQHIIVVVQEPGVEASAVPDANVTITLATKSGDPIPGGSYSGSTDADGRMDTSVPLEQFDPGDVIVVKAEVGYGALRTEAETSFVVWW